MIKSVVQKLRLKSSTILRILKQRLLLLIYILLAGILFLFLIKYHPNNSNLNYVHTNSTQSLFDTIGANIADTLLQFIGIGIWLLPPIILGLSFYKLNNKPVTYLYLRIISIILAIIFLSCAMVFHDPTLPIDKPHDGGLLGLYITLPILEALETSSSSFNHKYLSIILITLSILLTLFSAGVLKKSITLFFRMSVALFTHTFMRKRLKLIKPLKNPDNRPISKTTKEKTPRVKNTINRREPSPSSNNNFQVPTLDLLQQTPQSKIEKVSEGILKENALALEAVLKEFGINGKIINIRLGPVVTLYELEPSAGLRSSRVIGLADDIARSMSATSCRVATIPGQNLIGIEMPNQKRETIYLHELLNSKSFLNSQDNIPIALGKDIGGKPIFSDLAKMPHLLVAGTTGSGKSVGINTMLLSLLYRFSPAECRLILIDPKMLELSVYDDIPHLLSPVVTEPKKAVIALKWAVQEMENRYRKMSKIGVRNITGYNEKILTAQKSGKSISRRIQTGFDENTGEAIFETQNIKAEKMPFIVVVIDEMADLMLVAGKEIEGAVQRLAQMARAAGVHLITATQRPSVDVITGTIKANFPSRISFRVTSKIDSRTVLGGMGGEQLLGMGDMLFMSGSGQMQRIHGPFVSDEEVSNVVNFLKRQKKPEYIESITQPPEENITADSEENNENSLYDQAVAIVIRDNRASTSYIQRRLKIGYNRAATLIEKMEEEGVISSPNHTGKRTIIAPRN